MKVFEESIFKKYYLDINYLISDITCAWYQENMFVELKCAFYRKGYLTMISEYMPGGNLKTMLDQKSNFEEDEIKYYIARLAWALRHLHSLEICFPTLNLRKLHLDYNGYLKIRVFFHVLELYRHTMNKPTETGQDDSRTPLTDGINIEYIAPETFEELTINNMTDWWSFGIITYEL
jgi:serine/threonine protein kinase